MGCDLVQELTSVEHGDDQPDDDDKNIILNTGRIKCCGH